MKQLPHRLFRAVLPLLAISFLPTACSTGGGCPSASPPKSVSIAVREFSAADAARASAGDRGVRDFEKFYLPAQVIMALKRNAGVSAYFTMADTAATDFVADAVIQSSNGKRLTLAVTLTRVDGRKVFSKRYTVDHEDARERVLAPKMDLFFAGISRDLVAKAKSTTISLPHARARAYAGGGVAVSEGMLTDGQTAGEIERESILSPLTSALLPRAQIAAKVYTEWQVVTIPLQKDRSLAQYEQNVAAAGSALAMGVGALSAVQSAQFAAAGNQAGVKLANQNLNRAQGILIGSETVRRTAANREQAIVQALNAYKNQFVSGMPRQLTVRIYNKLLTLHGSQQDMLREFRQVVKEKLNAS